MRKTQNMGIFGKERDSSNQSEMYLHVPVSMKIYKYLYMLYVLYVLLSNQIDIFIICSTSWGRASPHQGISRLDPYTTHDLLGKSLGIVKYSLRTEGILPIFGKQKRNCVNYILMIEKMMQLWQPTTHLSQQTCHWHLIILPCAGICQNRFSSVTFS